MAGIQRSVGSWLARPAGQGGGRLPWPRMPGRGGRDESRPVPAARPSPRPAARNGVSPPQHPQITAAKPPGERVLDGGGGRQVGCSGPSCSCLKLSPAGLGGSLVNAGGPGSVAVTHTGLTQCLQGPSSKGLTRPTFPLGSCSCHPTKRSHSDLRGSGQAGTPSLPPGRVNPTVPGPWAWPCWELALALPGRRRARPS